MVINNLIDLKNEYPEDKYFLVESKEKLNFSSDEGNFDVCVMSPNVKGAKQPVVYYDKRTNKKHYVWDSYVEFTAPVHAYNETNLFYEQKDALKNFEEAKQKTIKELKEEKEDYKITEEDEQHISIRIGEYDTLNLGISKLQINKGEKK
jgi:hypothetical protein